MRRYMQTMSNDRGIDVALDRELKLVRLALRQGDAHHAAAHLSSALELAPEQDVRELIRQLVKIAADPATLVAASSGLPYGALVLRALLLDAAGRTADAILALLRAQVAEPSRDIIRRLDEWTASERVVDDLDLDLFADLCLRCSEALLDPSALLTPVDRVRRRRPDGRLALVASRLRRRLGFMDEALDVSRQAHAQSPGYWTALALAGALRDRGDLVESLEAYELALPLAPPNARDGVLLDVGDVAMDLDLTTRASRAYEEVLERQPGEQWARTSLLFLRGRAGDAEAEAQLAALARKGNDARADALFRRLDPLGSVALPPEAAVLNIARQIWDGGLAAAVDRVTVSSVEPPSAVLSLQLAARSVGRPEIRVDFAEIPSHDPRLPGEAVERRLWTYATSGALGTVAIPALPPPRAEVASEVASIASSPYFAADWCEAGRVASERLGRDALLSVLAAMVHPEPLSPGVTPWEHVFRTQLAAAMVAVWMDTDWPTATVTAVRDVLRGAVDWTTTAMIIALSQRARAEPSLAELVRKDVLGPLLEKPRSPIHFRCVFAPVVLCLLRLPRVDVSFRAVLRDIVRQYRLG